MLAKYMSGAIELDVAKEVESAIENVMTANSDLEREMIREVVAIIRKVRATKWGWGGGG